MGFEFLPNRHNALCAELRVEFSDHSERLLGDVPLMQSARETCRRKVEPLDSLNAAIDFLNRSFGDDRRVFGSSSR
jgi:hypothetical protein